MIRLIFTKAKNTLIILLIMLFIGLNYAFSSTMSEKDWRNWINKCLSECYNPSKEGALKKWEITITSQHFVRLRKTYKHGKQEYHSFHINKLDSVNYFGTTTEGALKFKTIADDIIVQTYGDPKGDIDSMASVLIVPVKGMSPERLDSLNNAIIFFKANKL